MLRSKRRHQAATGFRPAACIPHPKPIRLHNVTSCLSSALLSTTGVFTFGTEYSYLFLDILIHAINTCP